LPQAPAFSTDRAVLPALQVEVVAGDVHHKVQPGNNSIKVDMQPGSDANQLPSDANSSSTGAVNASQNVRMSANSTGIVTHQVTPDYPLLAKQMKVQGAVVLQALIDKQGDIQDLRILEGPAILSSAAREAVRQWRFKPYYQGNQPVETQARITVNFTISTY
jgi:protein TonB